MAERLFPDPTVPGAYEVRFGVAAQSWVDPARPDLLMFEYTKHISLILEHAVMATPEGERLRFVHVGGGGLTMPRWVAWRRPGSAQIVLEPDVELTNEVRAKVPLPDRSGIKVRDLDGRRGISEMPDDYADVVIVDAFDGMRVPAELVSAEFMANVYRVGRGPRLVVFNIADKAPFEWSRRVAAGVARHWPSLAMGSDPSVWKGRRYGNLLVVGSAHPVDLDSLQRDAGRQAFGYQFLGDRRARNWVGDAEPFTDADTVASPEPWGSSFWWS